MEAKLEHCHMAINVTKEGNRWVARFPFSYETKDLVKAAGFRFDGGNKLWYTLDPDVALKLKSDNAAEVAAAINAERLAQQVHDAQAIIASRKAHSDLSVPLSAEVRKRGWNFFAYQLAGIEYLMNLPAGLCADEMGLGKTMQAIGVVNCDPDARNVLCICKASLKLNWLKEAKLWLSRKMPVGLGNGVFPKGGFVIINYEMVKKYRKQIDAIAWDVLIVDECHMIKSDKAQRTHAILGKYDRDPSKIMKPIAARRRVFLTGTPILNRPCELWTLAHALDPQGLGRSWKDFHVRYCAAYKNRFGGWDKSGASNLDELQARLRSTFMVRRMKSEVLKELPAKRRQVIALQPSAEAQAALDRETAVVERQEAELATLRAAVAAQSPEQSNAHYRAAVAALQKARGVAFNEISRVRHETAVAKVPQVVDFLIDTLDDSDGKLVVMAHHHDVVDAIRDGLESYGVLKADGRDHIQVRQNCVDRFQNDDGVRVIVCGMQSMAEGHTLTASSHVIFAELDWTPGKIAQAEDRCHRIGQHDAVLVQHIVLDGSLDGRMAELLVEKMGVIEQAVDNGERLPDVETIETSQVEQVLKSIREGTNGHKADDEALSPDQVDAIHDALQRLAGMCDGARMLDGAGFNRLDTHFGHSLAAAAKLTPDMAKHGKRLCIRYQRQLPPDLLARIKG
jgi:SWI/SNF-related matrix-associated actin-dependent regulator 1 of chromatin subfamily A